MKGILEAFAKFLICGAALATVCWPLIAAIIILHFVCKFW